MSGLKSIDHIDDNAFSALDRLATRSKSLREATGEELAKRTYKMMHSGEVDELLCYEIAKRLRDINQDQVIQVKPDYDTI